MAIEVVQCICLDSCFVKGFAIHLKSRDGTGAAACSGFYCLPEDFPACLEYSIKVFLLFYNFIMDCCAKEHIFLTNFWTIPGHFSLNFYSCMWYT